MFGVLLITITFLYQCSFLGKAVLLIYYILLISRCTASGLYRQRIRQADCCPVILIPSCVLCSALLELIKLNNDF